MCSADALGHVAAEALERHEHALGARLARLQPVGVGDVDVEEASRRARSRARARASRSTRASITLRRPPTRARSAPRSGAASSKRSSTALGERRSRRRARARALAGHRRAVAQVGLVRQRWCSTTCSPSRTISAWRRDTSGSSSTTSQSCGRPIGTDSAEQREARAGAACPDRARSAGVPRARGRPELRGGDRVGADHLGVLFARDLGLGATCRADRERTSSMTRPMRDPVAGQQRACARPGRRSRASGSVASALCSTRPAVLAEREPRLDESRPSGRAASSRSSRARGLVAAADLDVGRQDEQARAGVGALEHDEGDALVALAACPHPARRCREPLRTLAEPGHDGSQSPRALRSGQAGYSARVAACADRAQNGRVHDLGLTHVALTSSDLDASIAFWSRYARMQVVHRRTGVVWLSDRTRPFVIVLAEARDGRASAAAVRAPRRGLREPRRRSTAWPRRPRTTGVWSSGPIDYGPPVGYWAFIKDPDGHTLEVSFGQEVGLTVEGADA